MNLQQRKEHIEQLQKEFDEFEHAENDEKIKNLSYLVGKCFKKADNRYQMITGVKAIYFRNVEYWAIDVGWESLKNNDFWCAFAESTRTYIATEEEIKKNIIPYSKFKKELLECSKHLAEMAEKNSISK